MARTFAGKAREAALLDHISIETQTMRRQDTPGHIGKLARMQRLLLLCDDQAGFVDRSLPVLHRQAEADATRINVGLQDDLIHRSAHRKEGGRKRSLFVSRHTCLVILDFSCDTKRVVTGVGFQITYPRHFGRRS